MRDDHEPRRQNSLKNNMQTSYVCIYTELFETIMMSSIERIVAQSFLFNVT